MLQQIYENICAGTDRRANLIELKKLLKEKENREAFATMVDGSFDEIMKCLVDEDAKVRKNAAEILGRMHCHEAADVLYDAYEAEEQLFVKSTYVEALAAIDCKAYLPELKQRLAYLESYNAPENEQKHIRGEISALRELLLDKVGFEKHEFTGYHVNNDILLTTMPAFRDALADAVSGPKKLLKSGVRFICTDLEEVLQIRIFQDLLFVIHTKNSIDCDPTALAQALETSDLLTILEENHQISAGKDPFYFRLSMPEFLMKQDRGNFAKKCAAEIEKAFAGRLVNSPSNYELEIKIMTDKEQHPVPFLKLHTIPDHRFDYRKEYVAASMRPVQAAGLMALAKPFFKEYAQVLDPFCGVGTMLIERKFACPVRNLYGIDTFGEAIAKARSNTRTVGMQVNYINRDYFDFTHEYLFDEIVTDMPLLQDKEEADRLYRRFLQKSAELLEEHGRIFLYTRQMGLLKKHLRLHNGYRILQEYSIQQKADSYFFVLEKK